MTGPCLYCVHLDPVTLTCAMGHRPIVEPAASPFPWLPGTAVRVEAPEDCEEWEAVEDAVPAAAEQVIAANAAQPETAADTVSSCREASARAWEGAADGAERDGHDRAPVEAAAEECDGHYEAAEEAIRGGNIDGAITALEWAASLEREWGDAQHAERALSRVRSADADAAAKAIESATFEAEGCERVTTRSYPRALAEAMAVILRARGMEASVAPDCDDRSQAWLYAYDGADSKVEVYEP